jgi:hypothetical protein
MNDASRRYWFQLHLSTVSALTLTAGGLLWVNGRKRVYDFPAGTAGL